MNYSAVGAIGAGLLSGVITVMLLYATMLFFPRQIKLHVFGYLGTAFPGAAGMWYRQGAGFVAFLVLAGLFGLPHAGLHVAFDVQRDIFTWGVIFGIGHWALNGLAVGYGDRWHTGVRGGVVPVVGPFIRNLNRETLIAFLGLHLVYGMFTGAFYDAFR